MTYEATISSKGQITIPVDIRRRLGLGKKINMSLSGNNLVINRKPGLEDMWRILDKPQRGLGLSEAELVRAQHLIIKDTKKRGY